MLFISHEVQKYDGLVEMLNSTLTKKFRLIWALTTLPRVKSVTIKLCFVQL